MRPQLTMLGRPLAPRESSAQPAVSAGGVAPVLATVVACRVAGIAGGEPQSPAVLLQSVPT